MPMRVLMTGHNGYIGSVMAPRFVEAGHEVVGLDTGYFESCTLVPDTAEIPWVRKDIRGLTPRDLEGFEAVVHLAALSNDPIGNLNAQWTEEINFLASVRLAEFAKSAGVERFLFSSSCIMYGMSEAAVVTEDSPLDPKTEYARSKVKSERAIAALAGDHFSPIFFRNGTVYGLSPRMRPQRFSGRRREHGEGGGVQRRQAVAPGGTRPRCRPRVPGGIGSADRASP
jgi:nucleoside-diphosphate-sugar epimerase